LPNWHIFIYFYAKIVIMNDQVSLNDKDWQIMRAISLNARMPVSRIARITGLKRETVKYHLNKLVKSGMVKFFLVYPDFAKLGYPVWGFANISFKDLDEKSEEEFNKHVQKNPHVIFSYRALGEFDYGIEFFAKTPKHLYEIQFELKKKFSKIIKDMRTGTFIETTKINYVPATNP